MKVHVQRRRKSLKDIILNQPVFFLSAVLAIAIVIWAIAGRSSFEAAATGMMNYLKTHFSWLYLCVMMGFLVFALVLAASRWGGVRLGPDDEKPEYSTVSWFAMLFGAGMGIGMVFWSVAEPLSHYIAPMNGIEPMSEEAKHFAIRSAFMHWGLHPWGCYAVMGLALAFAMFRRKEPSLVSSLLNPMFLRRNKKGTPNGLRYVVNTYTVLLTMIGVATSFGMGCLQISDGLNYLFGIPNTVVTWIVIIVLIAVVYIRNAVTGIGKGIKFLSDLNLFLFVTIMFLAFLVGRKSETLSLLFIGIRDYLVNLIPDSFRMSVNGDATWINNWRVFYWAWWLSWAPFVGIFIARISKGRTIREYVLGVVIVPTAVSVLWFSVFGNLAFEATSSYTETELAALAASPETALFRVLRKFPYGILLCLIAMALLVTFFITSANSATYVLAMASSRGNPDPSNSKKIFWGVLMAVFALALILSGGISVIQSLSIAIAFPYLFLLVLICINLVISLKNS